MEKPNNKSEQDDKNKYPPNCYKVGDSWMVDFTFRGERYREALGPVSRTVAKEKAASRKTKAAEGELLVNRKRWNGKQWLAEIAPARIDDPVFETALRKYLDWYRVNRRTNSYTLQTHNAKPLRAFFGKCQLSQISPFLIEKYKIERRQACECPGGPKRDRRKSTRCGNCKRRIQPRAAATLNRELTLLKHLFNKSLDWKLASSNPMESVELFKEDNGRTRYLTQQEAECLLSACNPDLRVVVLTAMHTGFRRSELKSLRWSSVDMDYRSITVQSCYAKNAEMRTVPMTDEVFEAFNRLRRERDRKPEDLVFVNRYGKPWKDWRTAFQNACAKAGIKDFRFHDLRHCFGSNLGMGNTNPKAMMELMGHRDPKMTMRYTHLSMDYKRQAVQKLPKFDRAVLDAESPRISPQQREAKIVGFAK